MAAGRHLLLVRVKQYVFIGNRRHLVAVRAAMRHDRRLVRPKLGRWADVAMAIDNQAQTPKPDTLRFHAVQSDNASISGASTQAQEEH
jgi:hypothetical protein